MAPKALNEKEITENLANLEGWSVQENQLQKTFQLETYLAGLALATAIGTVCEGLGHHPEMQIGYKKVTVQFTTHDAGSALTAKDFEAAHAVDQLGYPKSK